MKNDTAETLFPYFCIQVVSAAGGGRFKSTNVGLI